MKNIKSSSYDEGTTKKRYPFALVWTALPCVTFFLPSIGHTGICTFLKLYKKNENTNRSDGIIHDFGGSYYIGVKNI